MESHVYEISITAEEHIESPDGLEGLIERVVRHALTREAVPSCEVSILVTDDAGIRELNRSYRQKDQPTDVLSFPQEEDAVFSPDGDAPILLGDIVISLARAQAQAEEYGHSLEREISFLVVHGVLHLLGHDHEASDERERMRRHEEAILAELGITRTE